MPDDLIDIAPTDPSRVDADWAYSRQRILDGVLVEDVPSGSHAWRWAAGVAAAALVVVAVGGIIQQLTPEPYTQPASPAATPTPSDSPTNTTNTTRPVGNEQVVAGLDALLDTGSGMTLCNGHVMESRPIQCPFVTPVTGITWQDVPWAETVDGVTFAERTIIVGTFDGDTFVATQVFRENDKAAPQPPDTITDEELPTLCEDPIRGAGPYSVEALIVTAENLPGYQALWVSPNQVTYNVAVTEDVEGARSALAKVFGGELCVGTVDGPTEQALQKAEGALEPLKMDEASATTTMGSVWSTFVSISTRGNRIEVNVARDTPELRDQIQAAVGPDVWAFTDVIPFFYPVTPAASPNPPKAPAPTPSAMPQLDGTYIAQGGAEYRDGQISLCYSITFSQISSCAAAVPLLGLDPGDINWELGSVAAGHAFTNDVVVVGTIDGNGIRVERVQEDFMEVSGPGSVSATQDRDALVSAAADLVSSYDDAPFSPTPGLDDTDPEGSRLIVRVLLSTDDAVADIRQRLGENIWQYTVVRPFIKALDS